MGLFSKNSWKLEFLRYYWWMTTVLETKQFECHISNIWYQKFEYWILNIEYWILNIEYRILNIEYWILNIEYWILNIRYWILKIKNLISKMQKGQSTKVCSKLFNQCHSLFSLDCYYVKSYKLEIPWTFYILDTDFIA